MATAVKHFPRLCRRDLVLETTEFPVSLGEPIEITLESWDLVIDQINFLRVRECNHDEVDPGPGPSTPPTVQLQANQEEAVNRIAPVNNQPSANQVPPPTPEQPVELAAGSASGCPSLWTYCDQLLLLAA